MTSKSVMLRIFLGQRRTNPIEIMDPTNAANTDPQIEIVVTFASTIVVSATVNSAPEEIPSTNGLAIGFLKNVWIKNPESPSAPPKMMATHTRGKRIRRMIYATDEPSFPKNMARKMSRIVTGTLPYRTPSKNNTNRSIPIPINTAA